MVARALRSRGAHGAVEKLGGYPLADDEYQRLAMYFAHDRKLLADIAPIDSHCWFGVSKKREVPKNACYVLQCPGGRGKNQCLWVCPEHVRNLTSLTLAILDVATALTTSGTSAARLDSNDALAKALSDRVQALETLVGGPAKDALKTKTRNDLSDRLEYYASQLNGLLSLQADQERETAELVETANALIELRNGLQSGSVGIAEISPRMSPAAVGTLEKQGIPTPARSLAEVTDAIDQVRAKLALTQPAGVPLRKSFSGFQLPIYGPPNLPVSTP